MPVPRRRRLAVCAALGALSLTPTLVGCAASIEPRQANREVTSDVQATASPGAAYTVERGAVTEVFRMNGVVEAPGGAPYTLPYDVVVVEPPPRAGSVVAEGDAIVVVAPTDAVRAIATEFEAASYALDRGGSAADTASANARLAAAQQAAIAAGLPTDDLAAYPLPDVVAIPVDDAGTVLAVRATRGDIVRAGDVIAIVGDPAAAVVSADVTDSVTALVGIGDAVDVGFGDVGSDTAGSVGEVDAVAVTPDGSQLLTVTGLADPPGAGASASIVAADGRVVGGVVIESSPAVRIELDGPWIDLGAVVVSPRSDLTSHISGRVTSIHRTNGGALMTIAIPEGSLPFAAGVRVTIDGSTADDVLWLPPAAIRVFDGVPYVIVVDDEDGGARRRVEVELGLGTEDRVEVEGDLDDGDLVIGP